MQGRTPTERAQPWWEPEGDGWRRFWCDPPVYGHEWVEIVRREWVGPQVVCHADLSPAFNVADLWWRPARSQVIEAVEWREWP